MEILALVRAVDGSEGEECVLAIEMLSASSSSGAPEIIPALGAVLASPVRAKRYIAAQWLGELHDTEALPILADLLSEALPPPEDYPAACIDAQEHEVEAIRARLPRYLGLQAIGRLRLSCAGHC